jgi:hypothetical protein
MTIEQAFEELRLRGANYAVVDFSGGNDDGSADDMRLYRAVFLESGAVDLNASTELPFNWGHKYERWTAETPPPEGEGWIESRYQPPGLEHKVYDRTTPPESEDIELADALFSLAGDKYGSFAGEFRVHGSISWFLDRYDSGDPQAIMLEASESEESWNEVASSWP